MLRVYFLCFSFLFAKQPHTQAVTRSKKFLGYHQHNREMKRLHICNISQNGRVKICSGKHKAPKSLQGERNSWDIAMFRSCMRLSTSWAHISAQQRCWNHISLHTTGVLFRVQDVAVSCSLGRETHKKMICCPLGASSMSLSCAYLFQRYIKYIVHF